MKEELQALKEQALAELATVSGKRGRAEGFAR